MKHYRCFEVHVEKSLAKRTSETITFLPHNISMPNTISKSASLERIEDLVKLLQSKTSLLPFELHKDPTLTAIDRLSELFEPNKETQ